MASAVLATISRDEVERARLMSEFKYEIDTKSRINTAKWEGREEGRAEGRAAGMAEVARLALAEGMPVDFIRKITGLDAATIQNLGATTNS